MTIRVQGIKYWATRAEWERVLEFERLYSGISEERFRMFISAIARRLEKE
jgi:hypothetical protein